MAAGGSRGGRDDESKRYTEGGINVVALDRRGRGLHRARPELPGDAERSILPRPVVPRSQPWALLAVVLVLLAAAVTIAVLSGS